MGSQHSCCCVLPSSSWFQRNSFFKSSCLIRNTCDWPDAGYCLSPAGLRIDPTDGGGSTPTQAAICAGISNCHPFDVSRWALLIRCLRRQLSLICLKMALRESTAGVDSVSQSAKWLLQCLVEIAIFYFSMKSRLSRGYLQENNLLVWSAICASSIEALLKNSRGVRHAVEKAKTLLDADSKGIKNNKDLNGECCHVLTLCPLLMVSRGVWRMHRKGQTEAVLPYK